MASVTIKVWARKKITDSSSDCCERWMERVERERNTEKERARERWGRERERERKGRYFLLSPGLCSSLREALCVLGLSQLLRKASLRSLFLEKSFLFSPVLFFWPKHSIFWVSDPQLQRNDTQTSEITEVRGDVSRPRNQAST